MVAAQVANPERLAAVGATGLASNTDDPAFDRIARLASRLLGAPFGFVTLVDDHHSNWLACVGMPSDDRSERHTRVEESFCQYVVGLGDVLLIDDARSDARTRHNPSIESMGVVAWAGAPLRSPGGDVLGTVCVVDTEARSWTADDAALLIELSALAGELVERDRQGVLDHRSRSILEAMMARSPGGFGFLDTELRFRLVNEALAKINDTAAADHLGRSLAEIVPEMAEQLDPLIRSVLSTGEPIADVEVTARPSASPNDELVCSVGYFRIDDGDEPLGIGALVADVTERAHDRRRLEQLAKLTRRMSSAETVDQVATAIVHDGPPVVGADRMVVGQADSQTGVFELLAAEDPTKISSFQPVRGDRPLFDRVLATGETVLVGSRAQRLIEYPSDVEIADAVGVVATATVPLRRPDHSIFGLLTAGWNYEVARDDFPVAQLEVIADLCAQTLGRARAGVDRRALVSSLQTALLSPPPLVKDIEVAVRYVPAIDSLGFGGDWFDVVPIDSRRTALIVGDVVGHNAGAAARMSQLRTVISTLVQTGTSPSELFRRCDEVLDLRNQTTMATVAAVIVDTEAKTLSTVLAGHPPPLLMPRDGPAARLPAGLRPPLGVGADRRDPVTVPYEPGSTLLVYTDGLIESRGGDIDADIEALTARLGRVGRGTPENVAEGLLRVGADRASDGDDIALVVARL